MLNYFSCREKMQKTLEKVLKIIKEDESCCKLLDKKHHLDCDYMLTNWKKNCQQIIHSIKTKLSWNCI